MPCQLFMRVLMEDHQAKSVGLPRKEAWELQPSPDETQGPPTHPLAHLWTPGCSLWRDTGPSPAGRGGWVW